MQVRVIEYEAQRGRLALSLEEEEEVMEICTERKRRGWSHLERKGFVWWGLTGTPNCVGS